MGACGGWRAGWGCVGEAFSLWPECLGGKGSGCLLTAPVKLGSDSGALSPCSSPAQGSQQCIMFLQHMSVCFFPHSIRAFLYNQ